MRLVPEGKKKGAEGFASLRAAARRGTKVKQRKKEKWRKNRAVVA